MTHQSWSLNAILREIDQEQERLLAQESTPTDRSNRPARPLILAPKPQVTFKSTAAKVLRRLKQLVKNRLKRVLRA